MFEPVTKWSALMATPDAVPEMIRKAFKLAQTERPGAVYLAVPEDVEKAAAPAGAAAAGGQHAAPGRAVGEPGRAGGGRPARGARNPIVLAGHGAARAGAGRGTAPLRRDGSGVPVATTFHGKGVVPGRPSAGARRGRVHAPRLRELRVRPRRRRSSPSATSCRSSTRFGSIRTATRRSSTSIDSPPRSTLHYEIEVGLQSDIGRSAGRAGRRGRSAIVAPDIGEQRIRAMLADELERGQRGRPVSRLRRRGSWPTPEPRSIARTSCSSTPAR